MLSKNSFTFVAKLRKNVRIRCLHSNVGTPRPKPIILTSEERWPGGKPTVDQLYEPVFIESKTYPYYPLVNIRLRGYDFVVLERYQSYVHRTAFKLGLDIKDCWATAAKFTRVCVYKPFSQTPQYEYDMGRYERTVQLKDLSSVMAPILMDLVQTHLPQGVEMTMKEHESEDEESKFIPDIELIAAEAELVSLDEPNVRKKLGFLVD